MTTPQAQQGLLFILVGPGGGGKNTLINMVLEQVDNLRQLPTATTRVPRPHEIDGVHHQFVSLEDFQRMIAYGELIEYQEVHKNRYYGVPRATVENAIAAGQDLIADIEVLGASIIRSEYPNNAVLIFVTVPGETEEEVLAQLRQRMEDRNETPEEIEKRLKRVRLELPYAATCDYLIINDDMWHAADELRSIIGAENSRRRLLRLRASNNLPHHPIIYVATTIPYYNGEVLCGDSSTRYPKTRMIAGERPHDTALRAIKRKLPVNPSEDDLLRTVPSGNLFVPPISVDNYQKPYALEINFLYVYNMPERIIPPDGWRWVSLQDADLPEPIRLALPMPDAERS